MNFILASLKKTAEDNKQETISTEMEEILRTSGSVK